MPTYKSALVILLCVAAAIFGGTIYGNSANNAEEPLDRVVADNNKAPNTNSADNSEAEGIFVYVTGAVKNPGMIELKASNTFRIADAVNACGGLLPTADVDNFNMAEIISDGQHIRIPEKIVEHSVSNQPNYQDVGSSNTTNNSAGKSNGSGGGDMVNINTADSQELQTLQGIGAKMADRIIEYRQNNGSFKSIDEIQNVRGIGTKIFEKNKSRLKI